ncbi:MAG TPA: nucleoside-diphosphate kinase [Patescibacteria group bacterium]|nr:nucleoside-diphosphate kinase [Patescibacteria group bacterium]
MIERSLVILKSDAVARGLIGEIVSRLERCGLKMVASKLKHADDELAKKHYPDDREEFIRGLGEKSLDNYRKFGIDPVKEMGTDDAMKIGQMVQGWLVDYISDGPVFVMVWEGHHAIELIRKLCGHTLPLMATPGTIRGDLAHDSSYLANSAKRAIKNLMHASGSFEEAQYEIPLWFSSSEIYSYERVEEKVMR